MTATKKANNAKLANAQSNEMNFDFLNSLELSSFEKAANEKNSLGAKDIYKISKDATERERKTQRMKIKRERKKLVDNLLSTSSQLKKNPKDANLVAQIKKEVESFKSFYKANYILNDFSFESLSANNASENEKQKLNIFLLIVKNF